MLSAAGVAAVLFTGSACAGVDGTETGAIRENVIEPGITAMEQADALACTADAKTLQTAMEAYEILQGEPAPDEAALVVGQMIREESALWDIVDGTIVAVPDSGCG